MSAYRDTHNLHEAHAVTFDGVRLEFGEGGLLRDPNAEQIATMEATALRRARFVAVDEPPAAAPTSRFTPVRRPVSAPKAADADVERSPAADDEERS